MNRLLVRGHISVQAMADLVGQVQAALDQWGWVKHEWHSPHGVCLLGASEHVLGVPSRLDDDSEHAAWSRLGPARFAEAHDAGRRIRREVELHDGHEYGNERWPRELRDRHSQRPPGLTSPHPYAASWRGRQDGFGNNSIRGAGRLTPSAPYSTDGPELALPLAQRQKRSLST